jgi:hypothetical protein
MKLLIAAALLVAPAFADCCSSERVRVEARTARHEAQRIRADAIRHVRRYRTEVMRDAARARVETRRAAREAYRNVRRNAYRERRWFF